MSNFRAFAQILARGVYKVAYIGTTSRARLADAAGRTLGEGRAGSSNLNAGIAQARLSILAATNEALAAAGLAPERAGDIVAGLGLAGANVLPL
eukprot:gene38034-45821_t